PYCSATSGAQRAGRWARRQMGPLRSDVEGVERLPQHAGVVVLDVLGGVDQHDGARLRIGGGLEQPARSIGIRQLAQVVLPKLLEVQFTGMEGLAELGTRSDVLVPGVIRQTFLGD